MTPSDMFSVVNMVAMAMWLLMIFLPRWKGTRLLIDYKVIPIALSIIYVIYLVLSLNNGNGLDFGSLESVMQLFTREDAVLAGWVHYLAFDLLIGMWILDQNQKLGINHIWLVPCLLGTFMVGPVGFLLFIILRYFKKTTS